MAGTTACSATTRACCRAGVLRVGGTQPSLLAADVSRDNVYFTAHLTNRALPELGDSLTPRGIVHVAAHALRVRRPACTSASIFTILAAVPCRCRLAFHFASDFSDIFEVRGDAPCAARP